MCMGGCGGKTGPGNSSNSSYTPKKQMAKASKSLKASSTGSVKGWGSGFGASANFGQPRVTFSSRKK